MNCIVSNADYCISENLSLPIESGNTFGINSSFNILRAVLSQVLAKAGISLNMLVS